LLRRLHPRFGQAVGVAGRGSNTPRRPDRASASDHGAGARRPSQQEHCRRPRHQPAHGREPPRRSHEKDRPALAVGTNPPGTSRRSGLRAAISALTESAAGRHLCADRVAPRAAIDRLRADFVRIDAALRLFELGRLCSEKSLRPFDARWAENGPGGTLVMTGSARLVSRAYVGGKLLRGWSVDIANSPSPVGSETTHSLG